MLLILEEHGIELIDESEAEEREAAPANSPAAREEVQVELDLSFIDDDDGKRAWTIPSACTCDPNGRDSRSSAARKKSPWPRRSKSPASENFRRRRSSNATAALRQVVDTLRRVHAGELPFDRTVKVSLTENLEKDKILQRMPHNLATLQHLMELNDQDFQGILDVRVSEEDKRQTRRVLRIRRRKMVTLVEELSIRTQTVQPLMKKLEQMSARMDELEKQIEDLKGLRSAREDRANLEKELDDLMRMTLEETGALHKRVEIVKKRFAEYEDAKRALLREAICGWS